jgi:hypothetical protein
MFVGHRGEAATVRGGPISAGGFLLLGSSSKKHPWIEVQPAAAHLAAFSGIRPLTMGRASVHIG